MPAASSSSGARSLSYVPELDEDLALAKLTRPRRKKTPKKKPAKSVEVDGDRNLPEIGHDEMLGEQQPGDALTATPPPGDQAVAVVGAEERADEQQPGDAVHADAGP